MILRMTRDAYKQAYEAARQELLQHLKKREQLDQKIHRLGETLRALRELCQEDVKGLERVLMVDSRLGFTDRIRRTFHMEQRPLSPTEIRDELLKTGIGRGQTNLLASIHTVLRRMVKAGEIEKARDRKFSIARRTKTGPRRKT
jgi:predicted transcriptional regulator